MQRLIKGDNAMPKRGKLKDIKINEVSLVDKPANKLPFLFFKREGAKESQFVKAKKKIKIEIESNGTAKGTKILVNGDELGKLRDFSFYFYGNDAQSPVSCNYSKIVDDKDGFKRTETFYLSKGEIMNEKTLKALQTYLGKDDIDFEKKVGEEEIEKALTLISEHYKESFPEDLENAVGVIAKCAANSFAVKNDKDVEKAGARLSKDMIKKLKVIIESLKSILPEVAEPKEKSGGDGNETDELAKQLSLLKEAIGKIGTEKEDDGKPDVAEITKQLKEVSERLATVEKEGATKKSITGDGPDKDDLKGAGENGEILWKSLQPK